MSSEILNKIIRNRKTIYPIQFSNKELSKEIINEILENALHAPTHRMTQPWFFKVYKGESKVKLSSLIKEIDQEKISKIKIDKFIKKINLSEVERVDETIDHFFLKISTGISLIIPRKELNNPDILREHLQNIGLAINNETDWNW